MQTDDLAFLNSLTKYPSIPTWHVIGDKGRLTPATEYTAAKAQGPWHLTEKLDGTNARIILVGMGGKVDAFLGSREHILWALGDRCGDPAMGIVAALRGEPVERAREWLLNWGAVDGTVITIYGEVFGGKVGAGAKGYTSGDNVGFRVFDMRQVLPSEVPRLRQLEPGQLAMWRERSPDGWFDLEEFQREVAIAGLETVPHLATDTELPVLLEDAHDLLRSTLVGGTYALLDGGGTGKAEGIVARTADRSKIVKLRFEDYERTLRKKPA